MKPYFSCYIEGSGDLWEAICVDFDISMSGRSLDEVMSLLEYAVRSYVSDAMARPDPDKTRLLNRRTPLHVRLKWKFRVLTAALFTRRDAPAFEGHFIMPCLA